METGDWGIGVRSSFGSSVAIDVAASRRSSHGDRADGSAEYGLGRSWPAGRRRSPAMSTLPRFTQSLASLDRCFRCCASFPRFVTDCFLDRFGPRARPCRGGNVDDRPGGEVAMIDGSRSLGRPEFSPEKGSLVMSELLS